MMPLDPTWEDLALRLILTMIAAAIMGFNRGARGHAAGLRTTILVALAAATAMILTNLLLSLAGKVPDSFATMDPMRLPLGILTGVGFLGGGAILKKDGAITGVTTAATLWIATVIGLCFGADQLGLGTAATGMGILTLWAMELIDVRIPREHHAILVISTEPGAPPPNLAGLLRPLGYHARLRQQLRTVNIRNEEVLETHFELSWKQPESVEPSLNFLPAAKKVGSVKSFELISGGDR
jgi:putative Mg2+ transporter-C (MgtC) family protein